MRCLRPMGMLKAAHVARLMQLPEGVEFDRALRASRRLTSRTGPLIEGKAAEEAARYRCCTVDRRFHALWISRRPPEATTFSF